MSTSCWTIGNKPMPNGYVRVYREYAHRLFYESFKGNIPHGLTIDHLCLDKACVNPDHLEAVTQNENTKRADKLFGIRSGATHCPSGHEYNSVNTRVNKITGRRQCRPCNRLHQQKYVRRLLCQPQ